MVSKYLIHLVVSASAAFSVFSHNLLRLPGLRSTAHGCLGNAQICDTTLLSSDCSRMRSGVDRKHLQAQHERVRLSLQGC